MARIRENEMRLRTFPSSLAVVLSDHGSPREQRRLVLWAVGVTTGLRLIYAAAITHPLGGPDSVLYHDAARAFAEHGLLSGDIPGIPWAPGGYPILLGGFYELFGATPRGAIIAQVVLIGAATLVAHSLVARELGDRAALITVLLLCVSPSLFDSSATVMYEPVLGATLVIAFDLLSRAVRSSSRSVGLAALGGATLGVAVIVQPKVLLTGVLALAWLAARRPRLAPAVACAVALAAVSVGGALRTDAATGHFALAANGGENTFSFAWKVPGTDMKPSDETRASCRRDAATAGDTLPPSRLFAWDRHLRECALNWAWSHPGRAAKVAFFNGLSFWSPMVGALVPDRSVWYHPFDYRRLAPTAIRDRGWFDLLNVVGGNLWTALTLALFAGGTWLGLRRPGLRWGTTLLLIPTTSFLLVTMATVGDARYRLPVTFFYTPLFALALIAAWQATDEQRFATWFRLRRRHLEPQGRR